MAHKYQIIISRSDEDRTFVAEAPEFPGCTAHGDTADAALSNCGDAMALWLETAKEVGRPFPVPKGWRLSFA